MSDVITAMRPVERYDLGQLLAPCPRVAFAAGEVHGTESFPAASLLIVERGIIAVAARPSAKRRMVLSFCREGAVLPAPGRDEELAALTDSSVVIVTPAAQSYLFKLPAAAEAITRSLVDELRERSESLAQLAYVTHSERLRRKFFQLARVHGTIVPGGIRIELPLTHELLAETIGSARETVTLALRTLEGEGFVVREGRFYRLLMPAGDARRLTSGVTVLTTEVFKRARLGDLAPNQPGRNELRDQTDQAAQRPRLNVAVRRRLLPDADPAAGEEAAPRRSFSSIVV